MAYYGTAVLPTGESINPSAPQGATYYDREQVAYVMFKQYDSRTRPTRVVTSFGALDWTLGKTVDLYHDQTGAQLGTYKVVGIRDFATGESAGDVPNIKIKHCVVK